MAFSPSIHAEFLPAYFNLELSKQRCLTKYTESEELFRDMFSHNQWYTLPEMSNLFEKVYHSGRRLGFHANYDPDEDQFFLYYKGPFKNIQPVPISPDFIASVTGHIEKALQNGFASFVFFPDMGHSHIYFTEKQWQEHEKNINITNRAELYKRILADPEMLVLYHLSERLACLDKDKNLIQDDTLLFKCQNRNFMTKNDRSDFYKIYTNRKTPYNTVTKVKDYKTKYGFAVSASKKGCFPYQDKNGDLRYFDISLYDPRYKVETKM